MIRSKYTVPRKKKKIEDVSSFIIWRDGNRILFGWDGRGGADAAGGDDGVHVASRGASLSADLLVVVRSNEVVDDGGGAAPFRSF